MKLEYLIFGLIILVLVAWTLQRNMVYQSDVRLWEDTFMKSPNKPRVCVNLAYAYKRIGENDKGIAALTRAFKIDPLLPAYFEASKYANEHGGRLITEKDVWDRR